MKFHALLRSSAVSPPHPPSPGIAQIQYKERHSMSRSGNIPTAGINAPVCSSIFGTSAMGGVDVLVEVCERHTVRPCANTSCTHTTLPSVARASQAWGIDEAVRGTDPMMEALLFLRNVRNLNHSGCDLLVSSTEPQRQTSECESLDSSSAYDQCVPRLSKASFTRQKGCPIPPYLLLFIHGIAEYVLFEDFHHPSCSYVHPHTFPFLSA